MKSMLWYDAQHLSFELDSLGISDFMGHTHLVIVSHWFKDYLGGENAPASTMVRRANNIHTMITTWLSYSGLQA